MTASFKRDPHPGRPRILFVGSGSSSHTHSWVDLLDDAEFNVRLFALPTLDLPPAGWRVRTYVTGVPRGAVDASIRRAFNPGGRFGWAVRHARNALWGGEQTVISRWLRRTVRQWRPHIVHTLGLEPSAYLFFDVITGIRPSERPTWVAQVRGGPDLALHRFLPEFHDRIVSVLTTCDQLIADNQVNYDIATSMGLPSDRIASLGVVPGTGGVDVPAPDKAPNRPSRRDRTILWPKAYDSQQNVFLPVLEAIRSAWHDLTPCTIDLLATTPLTRMWVQALPEEVRSMCRVRDRIPRQELLEAMSRARVMLAPSVSDGVPNVLYEAMAHGAFPVVSPLETIVPLIEHGHGGLLARNLYPDEIAHALVRAMSDDDLVDTAADVNLDAVRRVADRSAIGQRVVDYYQDLATQHGVET